MLFKAESAERGPRKMATQKTSTMDDERRFRPGFCERLQSSLSLSLPFHRGQPHATMGEPLELQSHHLCTSSSKKNGCLRSACEKICWLVRTDLASGTCEEDLWEGDVRARFWREDV